MQFARLYQVGVRGECFNLRIFSGWMLLALVHAAICYWIPVLSVSSEDAAGLQTGKEFVSWASFSAVIYVVNLKLVAHLHKWNIYIGGALLAVVTFFYVAAFVICTEFFSRVFAAKHSMSQYHLISSNFGSIAVALLVPLTIGACLVPDIFYLAWQRMVNPHDYQIIQEMENQKDQQMYVPRVNVAPLTSARSIEIISVEGEEKPESLAGE